MTVTGKVNSGRCSWFGGSDDTGMAESEPLAFIFEVSQAPDLFVDGATEALGRNLDGEEYYIAMRWDYDEISKELKLAPGTVMSRLSRARKELKKRLEGKKALFESLWRAR